MLIPPNATIEQARRALLAGDRAQVEELLDAYSSSSHAETRWLLAAAAEDLDVRSEHLHAVISSRVPPYADQARAILTREHAIEAEIERIPGAYGWIVRRQRLILLFVALVVIAIGILVVATR